MTTVLCEDYLTFRGAVKKQTGKNGAGEVGFTKCGPMSHFYLVFLQLLLGSTPSNILRFSFFGTPLVMISELLLELRWHPFGHNIRPLVQDSRFVPANASWHPFGHDFQALFQEGPKKSFDLKDVVRPLAKARRKCPIGRF